MASSVQMTTAVLRDEGIHPRLGPGGENLVVANRRGMYEVVEHTHHATRKRVDHLGFIDILVYSPVGVLGIQAAMGDGTAHLRKMRQERSEAVRAFLGAGCRIEIWDWAKVQRSPGSKTDRRMVWRVMVDEVTLSDIGG